MTHALPLDGRGAVITGGGRGIGAEAARQLAEAGASVVVTARSLDQIDAVAEALRADGHSAHAIPCDVGDPAQIEALRDRATEALGAVDIVVNNAGIASSATVGRTTLDQWEQIMRVNATGVFLVTQAFLQPMLDRGWGRVVNVSSVAGKAGAPYISAYCASKHAVIGFTRAAAVEVAERGVTVNAVCPGYVETDMATNTIDTIVGKTGLAEDRARYTLEKMSPQKRIFGSDEVAAQILYLCLPLSAGVNGQSLVLDGGAFQA